jgi:hypothetical protein
MVSLCVGVALCSAAALIHRHLQSELDAESRLVRMSEERAESAGRAASAASAPELDFVQRLPVALSVDALAQNFHKTAAEVGAVLVSVSAEPHRQSGRTIGRWTLTITLRGPYAGLKQTLSKVLPRYPSAVIEAMRLKRDVSGSSNVELEMQVVFPLRFVEQMQDVAGVPLPSAEGRDAVRPPDAQPRTPPTLESSASSTASIRSTRSNGFTR